MAVPVFTGRMKHLGNCGDAHRFVLTEGIMSYESPTRGQPLHVTRKFFNPDAPVMDGMIFQRVTIDGVQVETARPICETTVCPIPHGDNDYSSYGIWPEWIKGDVTIHQEWSRTDGEPLLCLNASFDVGRDGYFNERNYTYTNYTVEDALAVGDLFLPGFPVIITYLIPVFDEPVAAPSDVPTPAPTAFPSVVGSSAVAVTVATLKAEERGGPDGFDRGGGGGLWAAVAIFLLSVCLAAWRHARKR